MRGRHLNAEGWNRTERVRLRPSPVCLPPRRPLNCGEIAGARKADLPRFGTGSVRILVPRGLAWAVSGGRTFPSVPEVSRGDEVGA